MSLNTKPIRTRLAPSPTGLVHIGTVRTGLFNFLFARKYAGQFILRVEDTDRSRFVEGAMENMIEVMQKFGIFFDEGPRLDEHGKMYEVVDKVPYIQSDRLDIYQKYTQELLEKKLGYYCFCSSDRLEELRKEQMALKKPAMYDRLCRNLTDEEVKTKLAEFELEKKRPVVRQANPLEGETIVND